jgi:hypothetical protein
MNQFKNMELKLFLSFFIIYSLFSHWIGWNEYSRLFPAISIVDKNKISINEYANFTGDIIVVNGNTFSDKPPAAYFYLTPFYLIFKSLFKDEFDIKNKTLIPQPQAFDTKYEIVDINEKSILLTIIFGTILLGSLPGAICVVVFYKIALIFLKERTSILLSIIFGFSTLLFPYSTTLLGNTLSLLFLLLSIYSLLSNNITEEKKYILGGLFCGLSLSTNYISLLSIFAIIIWLKISYGRGYFTFLISLLLGSLTLLINPITIPNLEKYINNILITYKAYEIKNIDNTSKVKNNEFFLDLFKQDINYIYAFNSIIGYTISPYRGLFFYSPVLLFFFIGLLHSWKRNKLITILSISIFLVHLIFISLTYYFGYGGSTFGPRYLLNIIPFLLIPIGYFIEYNKSKLLQCLLFATILISTFHMILSTSAGWEEPKIQILEGKNIFHLYWNKKFSTTNILFANPLYEYYLQSFIENGPKSRILEYILIGEIPDIRDFKRMTQDKIKLIEMPFGFILLKLKFLPIIMLFIILIFVFRKELSNVSIFGITIDKILLLLIILVLLSRIEIGNLFFDKGWNRINMNENSRWMGRESKIYIFSPYEKESFLNISIFTYRFKTLELYLNGNLLGEYYSPNIISQPVKLKKGKNELIFKSKEGCEMPIYAEDQLKCLTFIDCKMKNISFYDISFDTRCLSFIISNISIIDFESLLNKNYTILLGSGIYPSFRNEWLASKNANMYIYSPNKKAIFINISTIRLENINTSILLNNNFFTKLYSNSLLEIINLENGINELKFVSDLCIVPAKITNKSIDYRCLSLLIRNITLIDLDEIKEGVYFGNGWYNKEEMGRWMSSESIIYIVKLKNYSRLILELESFKTSRKVLLELENKYYTFNIESGKTQKIFVPLKPNEITKIKISTYPECENFNKSDNRCYSILLREFSLENI